ncbi:MAG: thioredoxin domain-containing protein, partial [Deltaproteobacteria bacterium]|nr:thioredoxin domain-containing protein [Deltaproteobacteria bacterium]
EAPKAAEPAPAPAAAPAAGALPTMEQIGAMEKTPGATPPLEGSTVPSPNTVKTFPGAPGPHPASGPDDAPVKVFIFSDFQCPVCSRVVEPAKLLSREFPNEVQIIFIHNALEMHQNAAGAAAAAIAAQRQGKFWAFHDKLFQNQQNLHEQDLILYAEELGLDSDKFQKDMKDPAVKAQVDYERALAAELGLQGTPGFMINGQKQVGWGSYGGFKSMVARALGGIGDKRGPDVAIEATKASGDDGKKFAELYWGK